MKMLLFGGTVCTFDEERTIFSEGVVAIDGSEIVFVGDKVPSNFCAEVEIDCHGCIILPGFVNTHVHLGEYLFKGLMDEVDFRKIFFSHLFLWEACLDPETVYWGSLAAAVEALRCGITTVGEVYHHSEASARAIEASGLRARIGQLIYGFSLLRPFKTDGNTLRFDFAAFKDQLAAACQFAESWEGKAEGRITTSIAPHATNTLTPKMLEKIAQTVENKATWLIHMHVAQMKDEYESVIKRYHVGCVELLSKIGILRHKFLGAHAIFLKPNEIGILASAHAAVAHNPLANAKDAGLVAPVVELVKAGVRIGLGTDAFHSNLLEVARITACLQRVRTTNAEVCPAQEVLYWATRGGAVALGLEDVGVLKPGKKADLVVIDTEQLNLLPIEDPYKSILYYAEPANIRLVIVNGQIVVENGKIRTVNLEDVRQQFLEAVKLVRRRVDKKKVVP